MCQWQQLRNRLNHNWLKNEYLKSLDSLILQIQARHSWHSDLNKYLKDCIRDWNQHRTDLRILVTTAEDDLSPRNLFDREPLSNCTKENKEWMIPLTHNLWLDRSGILAQIKDTLEILDKADTRHAVLEKLDLSDIDSLDPESLIKSLESFADTVKILSSRISRFPDRISVI